jgi:hypothetical protein
MAGSIAELTKRVLAGDFRNARPKETEIILLEVADRILSPFSEKLSASAKKQLEQLGVEVRLNQKIKDIREGAIDKTDSHTSLDDKTKEEPAARRSRSSKPKEAKRAKSSSSKRGKSASSRSRQDDQPIQRSNSSGSVLSFLDGTMPDKVMKRSSSRSASKPSSRRSKSKESRPVSRASSSGSILAFLDGTKD